jgi:hypothetical protein
MVNCTKEMLWFHNFLSELNDCNYVKVPMPIFCDNQGAIHVSSTYIVSERTKHMDVRYLFLKDIVAKGLVKFEYVPSSDNVADIFTKALSGEVTATFREMLGLVN